MSSSWSERVGLAAQLYGPQRSGPGLDPIAGSRSARPFAVPERSDALRPFAESQRVFNGVHEDVQKQVKEYAEDRNEGNTPYGWRKYLASQEWYLRFCCFSLIRELVQQPPPEPVMQAAAREEHGS